MLLHVGLILYDRYYARRQLRLAEAVSTLPFPPPAAHESPAVTAASRAREDALAALPTRRGGAPPVASPPLDGAADVAVVAAAALALSLDCGSGGYASGGDAPLPGPLPTTGQPVASTMAVAAAAAAATAVEDSEAVDEAADGAGRPGDAGGSPAGAPPTCAVCMGDLDAAEEVVVLPCGHVFHSGPTCVRAWLAFRDTCPTCRAPVASLVAAPLPRRRRRPRRPRPVAAAGRDGGGGRGRSRRGRCPLQWRGQLTGCWGGVPICPPDRHPHRWR